MPHTLTAPGASGSAPDTTMQRLLPVPSAALPVAFLALLPLLNGCAAVAAAVGGFEDPQLVVRSSKVTEYSPSTASITLDVEVYNPNRYALSLRHLQYELFVGGSVLARGENSEELEIRGGESAALVLPLTVAIQDFTAADKVGVTFGEVPYELRATLLLAALLLEREVTITQSSVLQINLPLGLVRLRRGSTVDSLESTATSEFSAGVGNR